MGAITQATVSVTTSATALNTADPDGWIYLDLTVPSGGQTVFLGDSSVTSSAGGAILAGTTKCLRIPPNCVLYGIVAATTQNVNVVRLIS